MVGDGFQNDVKQSTVKEAAYFQHEEKKIRRKHDNCFQIFERPLCCRNYLLGIATKGKGTEDIRKIC